MNSDILKNTVVTTDLHLSESKHAEYRWKIFPELCNYVHGHGVQRVYILGDLTNEKDHHSADFVRRVWLGVKELSKYCLVTILKGNHDYRSGPAFFAWLDELPTVTFIDQICNLELDLLMLPHTRMPTEDWHGIRFQDYRVILMHETLSCRKERGGYRRCPP